MGITRHIIEHDILGIGAGSGGGPPPTLPGEYKQIVQTIIPGDTQLVDTFSITTTKTYQYLVLIENDLDKKYSYELNLINIDNLDVDYTMNDMIGYELTHGINFSIVGTTVNMEMTNQTSRTLTVRLVRINMFNF